MDTKKKKSRCKEALKNSLEIGSRCWLVAHGEKCIRSLFFGPLYSKDNRVSTSIHPVLPLCGPAEKPCFQYYFQIRDFFQERLWTFVDDGSAIFLSCLKFHENQVFLGDVRARMWPVFIANRLLGSRSNLKPSRVKNDLFVNSRALHVHLFLPACLGNPSILGQ